MFKSVNDGTLTVRGWYSFTVPRTKPKSGNRIRAAKVIINMRPPALCTHLPTPRPRVAANIIAITSPVLIRVMNHLVLRRAWPPSLPKSCRRQRRPESEPDRRDPVPCERRRCVIRRHARSRRDLKMHYRGILTFECRSQADEL